MYYSCEESLQPCSVTPVMTGNIICQEPGCNFRIHRLKQFQHHLASAHGFNVNTFTLYFESLERFYVWKDEYEQKNGFTFAMLTTKDKASHVYYYCSLGRKSRVENGKRRMSNQCPTRLVLNCNRNTGQVYVDLIDGHYGHAPPVPDASPPEQLSKIEIQLLKEIMRYHNFNKRSIREHLASLEMSEAKQELFLKEFDKKKFHEVYKWCEETFVAESPVTEWQRLMPQGEDCAIIIHKRRGEVIPDLRHQNCHHRLNMEDFPVDSFMIGVVTDAQKELLARYGSTIVLELVLPQEAVPHKNSIKQLYVLVMDHLGRELQVGFFVVSCPDSDTRAFRSFFLAVKAKCGSLTPELLLVNERSCLFRCWLEVFSGHIPSQLLSPWFIEAEFNSAVMDNMIPDTLMPKLEELFVATVREFNVVAFEEKLATLINTLNASPGVKEALNYVSEMLLPCLNRQSVSSIQPKWAHHAFPSFKTEISLAIMTFTAEKLKGMHGFNNRKLGRCIYLMMQRQLYRRQLRQKQTNEPRTTLAVSTDAAVVKASEPTLDALDQQGKREQKMNIDFRCQNFIDNVKNFKSDAHLCSIGDEILKVTKLFNISHKGKYPSSQIKVTDDLYRSLNPDYQSPSLSLYVQSSFSLPGASRKRELEVDPELLTVKKNPNLGPIALSSYCPIDGPSNRLRTSLLSSSSSVDTCVSNTSSSCTSTVENNILDPSLNDAIRSVPSSGLETCSEPITVTVSIEDYHNSRSHNVESGDSLSGYDGRSLIGLSKISPDVRAFNAPVAALGPVSKITNVSRVSTMPPPATIPLHTAQPPSSLQVPSLSSANQLDGDVPSAAHVEENAPNCSASHTLWQIQSQEDGYILTPVKEGKDSDDEDMDSQQVLEATAPDF